MQVLLEQIRALPNLGVLVLCAYVLLLLCVGFIALRNRGRRRRRARVRRMYNQQRIFYRRALAAVFGLTGIVWIFKALQVFDEDYTLFLWLSLLLTGFVLVAYWYFTPLPSRKRKDKRKRYKFLELDTIPRGAALMIAIRRQKILAIRNHTRWFWLLLSGTVLGLLFAVLWLWLVMPRLSQNLWSDLAVSSSFGLAWVLCWFALLEHRVVPSCAHCPYCFYDWEIRGLRRFFFQDSVLNWNKCPGCGLRIHDRFPGTS